MFLSRLSNCASCGPGKGGSSKSSEGFGPTASDRPETLAFEECAARASGIRNLAFDCSRIIVSIAVSPFPSEPTASHTSLRPSLHLELPRSSAAFASAAKNILEISSLRGPSTVGIHASDPFPIPQNIGDFANRPQLRSFPITLEEFVAICDSS